MDGSYLERSFERGMLPLIVSNRPQSPNLVMPAQAGISVDGARPSLTKSSFS